MNPSALDYRHHHKSTNGFLKPNVSYKDHITKIKGSNGKYISDFLQSKVYLIK